MKTGMGLPLLGLVLLLALVLGWNAYNATLVDLAVARIHATASGQALPQPAYLAGEWLTKAIVGATIGGTVTAIVGALIVWARGKWNAAQTRNKWKGGQNAYWGRLPAAPRAPSEAELFRTAMMQNLMAGRGQAQGQAQQMRVLREVDDEPTISF
jgi:hypothetical protein